jgi:3-dehydroquinate dehydratase
MEVKRCKECVLVESPPDIFIGEDGVCNICKSYEAETDSSEPELLETDFLKILNKYRGQGKYDCLCMLSGGKDSTASLYYIKEKYKMNPLVFTFNHGFVPDEHIQSAKKTVEKLGVDWIYFETDFMKEMFKKIIKTKSKVVICPVCSLWYMMKTYEIAAQWDIPIIISGWTKGQTTSSKKSIMSKCACDQDPTEYSTMANATKNFMDEHVRTDPRYADFPASMEDVLKIARKKYKTKAIVLSPHWFVPSHPDEYVPIIKEKLDWDYPVRSYPKKSTNCDLNFLASKLAVDNFGYSHYHIEMSNLIRMGMITREEALALLEIDYDKEILSPILEKLDCKMEDLKK